MKFDPEQDGAPVTALGQTVNGRGYGAQQPPATEATSSRLKTCPAHELLEKLPRILKLMGRMIACQPEGSAATHPIVLVRKH